MGCVCILNHIYHIDNFNYSLKMQFNNSTIIITNQLIILMRIVQFIRIQYNILDILSTPKLVQVKMMCFYKYILRLKKIMYFLHPLNKSMNWSFLQVQRKVKSNILFQMNILPLILQLYHKQRFSFHFPSYFQFKSFILYPFHY